MPHCGLDSETVLGLVLIPVEEGRLPGDSASLLGFEMDFGEYDGAYSIHPVWKMNARKSHI